MTIKDTWVAASARTPSNHAEKSAAAAAVWAVAGHLGPGADRRRDGVFGRPGVIAFGQRHGRLCIGVTENGTSSFSTSYEKVLLRVVTGYFENRRRAKIDTLAA